MEKTRLIKTERLFLQEITDKDTELIVEWRSLPEVYRFFSAPHKITPEEHLNWFYNTYLGDRNRLEFVAYETETNSPVGVFGIRRDKDTGSSLEISYLLDQKARGRGYATEVVLALMDYGKQLWSCNEIFAAIHKDNAPSIALVRRLGFEHLKSSGNFEIYRKR